MVVLPVGQLSGRLVLIHRVSFSLTGLIIVVSLITFLLVSLLNIVAGKFAESGVLYFHCCLLPFRCGFGFAIVANIAISLHALYTPLLFHFYSTHLS
jgi:hypothetical protein